MAKERDEREGGDASAALRAWVEEKWGEEEAAGRDVLGGTQIALAPSIIECLRADLFWWQSALTRRQRCREGISVGVPRGATAIGRSKIGGRDLAEFYCNLPVVLYCVFRVFH